MIMFLDKTTKIITCVYMLCAFFSTRALRARLNRPCEIFSLTKLNKQVITLIRYRMCLHLYNI